MTSQERFLSTWVEGKIKIDTFFAWLFGIAFLLIALLISLMMPAMRGTIVLRIIVALSAAAITAGVPGLFTLNFLSPGKVLTVKMTGALLIFLIICAVDANPSQSIAFIQMSLILLTPFIIRQGLKHQRLKVRGATFFFLCAAFMLCEAAFFSQLAGGRLPAFPSPSTGTQLDNKILSGQDVIRTQQQRLWIPNASFVKLIHIRDRTINPPETLHLLLNVEWERWEKFPAFPRNYRGQIYYRMRYQCQERQFANRQIELVGYSLKPGRIVLSWLIGFVEIPFLLDDHDENGIIERLFREKSLFCSP